MPNWGNKGLKKYEDKFFVSGIGRVSFSVQYHDLAALARLPEAELAQPVRQSASGLSYRIRSNAPYRSGDLRRGIILDPTAERTAVPGKVVFDITFDAGMNDTFVKMTKAGKRYYYPASQEYGFRIGRARRHPGLYYMRDASVEFFPQHRQAIVDGVNKILEEL
jgi:hypothetical protein